MRVSPGGRQSSACSMQRRLLIVISERLMGQRVKNRRLQEPERNRMTYARVEDAGFQAAVGQVDRTAAAKPRGALGALPTSLRLGCRGPTRQAAGPPDRERYDSRGIVPRGTNALADVRTEACRTCGCAFGWPTSECHKDFAVVIDAGLRVGGIIDGAEAAHRIS